MVFLNPSILWGFLALSVPIIVHFFNLQRPKNILFSNVAFVKEVKRSVVRRLKFKQWLLLLLRLLAITGLVLAFANPIITSEDNTLLRGSRSVAFVVDNSYSMTAGNEKGPYFQQAQNFIRDILGAYSNEDEFQLMTTSDLKLNYNFSDKQDFQDELKNVTIEQNTTSITDILQVSSNIFSRANHNLKELYVISDYQVSTFMADTSYTTDIDSTIRFKLIPIGTRNQKNVYISDHKIGSQIIEKGKPVKMSMTIVNDGSDPKKDLSVRIMLEGKVVTITSVNLKAKETIELELSFTPDQSGWLSGFIALDDYPIEFDNNRYFSIYVPEAEKILIVEGQASENVKVLYQEVFDQFETTFVPARNISSISLNDFRSLIFVGLTNISSGLSDKLKNFLENGGSLLIFPGSGLSDASFNAFLTNLNAGEISEVVELPNGLSVETIDLEHPIFDGIFTQNNRNRTFDAPKVFRYYPLSLNNTIVQNQIMRLENEDPFLVESQIGEGLLFLFSVNASPEWSDFSLKTVFAPILFRMTQIMNQTQQIQSSQVIGSFEAKILRTDLRENLLLVSEDETRPAEIIIEPFTQRGVTILNFDQIFDKVNINEGNYQLLQAEELIEKISFNIADLESRLAFLDLDELEKQGQLSYIERLEIFPPLPETLQEQIQAEKEGTPIWKYFLILGLGALLLEMLVIKAFRNG